MAFAVVVVSWPDPSIRCKSLIGSPVQGGLWGGRKTRMLRRTYWNDEYPLGTLSPPSSSSSLTVIHSLTKSVTHVKVKLPTDPVACDRSDGVTQVGVADLPADRRGNQGGPVKVYFTSAIESKINVVSSCRLIFLIDFLVTTVIPHPVAPAGPTAAPAGMAVSLWALRWDGEKDWRGKEETKYENHYHHQWQKPTLQSFRGLVT